MSSVKKFKINKVNQEYYSKYKASIKELSFRQYKPNIGRFVESLGSIDLAKIDKEDIEMFVEEKESTLRVYVKKEGLDYERAEKVKINCRTHLRSILIFIIKNDINDAIEKVNKDLLIYLI